jgi:hypothetical protein
MLQILWLLLVPVVSAADHNHHLHNFGSGVPAATHAREMGYRFLVARTADSPRPDGVGAIALHNANVGPIRVYVRKSDGKLFVGYHAFLKRRQDNLNPVALLDGLKRENTYSATYPLTAEDFEILRNYSAARRDNSDLRFDTVTATDIRARFFTAWPLENAAFQSFNLLGNWQSRKVVDDFVAAFTTDYPWERCDALFFDSFGGGRGQMLANAAYGGRGSYKDRAEGAIDMVRRVTEYARNPARTGSPKPLLVFTNIYDPRSEQRFKTVLLEYGTGRLRLDHYYYEAGGLGQQAPNGVVPGTQEPAYVDPGNSRQAWLPASRVALDDTYAFVNRHLADYDREQHFFQHLDACGTAGLNGAWFGWYGEDNVDLKDTAGRLVFTNDLQLLRAIPNWDNLAGIAVPPFGSRRSADQRRWDGAVYHSPRSHASKEVMWSRHPDTNELFAVFRTMEGRIQLQPGETIERAVFADAWFAPTAEGALEALEAAPDGSVRLKPAQERRLKQGIRLVVSTPFLAAACFTPIGQRSASKSLGRSVASAHECERFSLFAIEKASIFSVAVLVPNVLVCPPCDASCFSLWPPSISSPNPTRLYPCRRASR